MGWPASDATQSTIVTMSFRSRRTSASGSMGWDTPVDVSTWTNATTVGRCSSIAFRSCSGRTAWPQGASTRRTLPPALSAMASIRSAKNPAVQTTTLSPGSIMLTIAVSIPAVPVPEIGSVIGLLVSKTLRSPDWTSSMTPMKTGSR